MTTIAEKSPEPITVSKFAIKQVIIGIDPGSETGLAFYCDGKIVKLESGSHSGMLFKVYEAFETENIALNVILEDVHADSTNFVAATFIKGMMNNPELKKQIPNEKNRMAYCINAACKRSRDSGMAAGLANDWKVFLEMKRIPYATMAPSKRDNAETLFNRLGKAIPKDLNGLIRTLTAPTKLNQKQFNDLTGWTKGSNEHARDAGTLAWWYAKQQKMISQN